MAVGGFFGMHTRLAETRQDKEGAGQPGQSKGPRSSDAHRTGAPGKPRMQASGSHTPDKSWQLAQHVWRDQSISPPSAGAEGRSHCAE